MNSISFIKEMMTKVLKEKPMMFSSLMDLFNNEDYRDILLAWGELREQDLLKRTPEGLYLIEG